MGAGEVEVSVEGLSVVVAGGSVVVGSSVVVVGGSVVVGSPAVVVGGSKVGSVGNSVVTVALSGGLTTVVKLPTETSKEVVGPEGSVIGR